MNEDDPQIPPPPKPELPPLEFPPDLPALSPEDATALEDSIAASAAEAGIGMGSGSKDDDGKMPEDIGLDQLRGMIKEHGGGDLTKPIEVDGFRELREAIRRIEAHLLTIANLLTAQGNR